MSDGTDYSALQNPAPMYNGGGTTTTPTQGTAQAPSRGAVSAKGPAKPPPKPKPPPEVEFVFHVISSVQRKDLAAFITQSMESVNFIWNPQPDSEDYDYDSVKKFQVVSKWSGSFKTIADKNNDFRRIDFPANAASDKALKLVKDNFSNPNFDPIVPVFICETAWDETNEPGQPRDGLMEGFTLVKTLPWFSGDRAILLFSKTSGPFVLAHELSHWCGFSHRQFEEDRTNIGHAGGSGMSITRDQLRKYFKWATEFGFRKALGVK